MPAYTAFLFTQPDGSYVARVPALPGLTTPGATRAQALENASEAATVKLSELGLTDRGSVPPEDWSPSRTVHVQNPRTKESIPYAVMVSRQVGDGPQRFLAITVMLPEVTAAAETEDEALTLLGPRLYERLTRLVAEKRDYPVQDDPSAYVINVRIPAPAGSGDEPTSAVTPL
jgi:predicted RNase H-like HicB family nuclease